MHKVENPQLAEAFLTDHSSEEVNAVFDLCRRIIHNPPENYRVVKQAVQAVVYISSARPDLRPPALTLILHVLQNPKIHRSNPRRWAVRSLGLLAAHDPTIVSQMLDLLTLLLKRENEQSQYVRKAAYCALSRIGRKYPHIQSSIVPFFFEAYQSKKAKLSIVWGALIGLGRMSQSSAALRAQMAPEWLRIAQDPGRHFRLRWACFQSLGHAVCPVGNVQGDSHLEERVFDICAAELDPQPTQHLTPDPFTESECFLVQYPAANALGLLLRSNPDKWWPRISPIFVTILQSKRFAAMVKSVVILTYGKIAFFSSPKNRFFRPILDILFSFAKNDYILVSEPAVFALTNFSICHPTFDRMYLKVRMLLLHHMFPGQTLPSPLAPPINTVPDNILEFFLGSWGRHVSRVYLPNLADCSKVVASSTVCQMPPLPPVPTRYVTSAIAVAIKKGQIKHFNQTDLTSNMFYFEEKIGHSTKVDDRGEFLDEESLLRSSSPKPGDKSKKPHQKTKQKYVSQQPPHEVEEKPPESKIEDEKEELEGDDILGSLIKQVKKRTPVQSQGLQIPEQKETELQQKESIAELMQDVDLAAVHEGLNERLETTGAEDESKKDFSPEESEHYSKAFEEAEKSSETLLGETMSAPTIDKVTEQSFFDVWYAGDVSQPQSKKQSTSESISTVVSHDPKPSKGSDVDSESDTEPVEKVSLGSILGLGSSTAKRTSQVLDAPGSNKSPPKKRKRTKKKKDKDKSEAPATQSSTPPRPSPVSPPSHPPSTLPAQPVALSTSKTDKTCKFFEVGMCRKGSACPFKHVGSGKPIPEPCRFFMSGSCNRGTSCPYVHDAKLAPCFKLFLDGHCEEGDSCRFSHSTDFWELYEKRRVLREQMKWEARVSDAVLRGEDPPIVPTIEDVRKPASPSTHKKSSSKRRGRIDSRKE
ncbi:hypothetical protein P9112_005645 [Eukaryota sp. TZLM1-RC]